MADDHIGGRGAEIAGWLQHVPPHVPLRVFSCSPPAGGRARPGHERRTGVHSLATRCRRTAKLSVGGFMMDAVTAALGGFSPATRAWFAGAFDAPTAAQEGAWRAISAGEHALVVAPTGSGKTLSAFLWALDRLASTPRPAETKQRCRVLYVSPLKALAVDIQRNLRAPLTGIRQASTRIGLAPPEITVGLRTGDTTAEARRAFV